MAKKKPTPLKQLLTTPLSPRAIIVFLFLGVSLLGYNIYVFQTKPPSKSSQVVLSQTDLMNVLGNSISLGEQEENNDQLKNDPIGAYWSNILKEKPDFRDAHIILATIAYNKHLCTTAQSHLASALALDPILPLSFSLKEKIIACGK